MSKSGQEMLNTSSTAYTQQYINTMSKLGISVRSAVGGAILGTFAPSIIGLKTLGAAGAGIATNNYLSRLLVDEKYVLLSRQFALQNAKGKPRLSTFKSLANRASIILRSEIGKEKENN